jgi:hypothetical protein
VSDSQRHLTHDSPFDLADSCAAAPVYTLVRHICVYTDIMV